MPTVPTRVVLVVVAFAGLFRQRMWRHAYPLARAMTCITRLRLDARLCTAAPSRRRGTNGRPSVKGERLPLLADVTTRLQELTIPGWSGAGARAIELTTGTAVWHHPGLQVLPIRWVLIRDPRRCFDPQALLSTDLARSAVQVVGHIV